VLKDRPARGETRKGGATVGRGLVLYCTEHARAAASGMGRSWYSQSAHGDGATASPATVKEKW
jgi:hypothetical protein